ncbi:hypothetical protein [Pseudomonas alabamensis]|uniref:hypothetical protein n=1 Tax=Pseudomonas alabamensis TaxID=3064349 RepID=UPI003F649FE9
MRISLWNGLEKVQSSLSMAEWAWKIFSIISVGGSAVVAGFLAKIDPVLKELGWVYWLFIALVAGCMVSFILLMIKAAVLRQSMAKYYQSLSVPKSQVNPMLETFVDIIIPVEDLRLPELQVHTAKHFRRCKFVGPATIAISGGTYSNSGFNSIGDIIALPPDSKLVGVTLLQNCVVESCDFIRVTIMADQGTARGFAEAGAHVKGLI